MLNASSKETNQEFINGLRYLILRARYRNYITCHLGAGKVDLAIPFLFELVNLIHPTDEFSMVQTIDDDRLGHEFCVLDKHQNMSVR
jgi:hypothetical protein